MGANAAAFAACVAAADEIVTRKEAERRAEAQSMRRKHQLQLPGDADAQS